MKAFPVILAASLTGSSMALSVEIHKNGDFSIDAGWWGQGWYQHTSNMGVGGDGLDDFVLRRSYLYVKANVTQELSFFTNLAGDKLGMDRIRNDSHNGLGSGIAVRDAWVAYKVFGDDLIVQAGRMYVPFTRNYGTTSTKSLLTTDLDWGQAGLRSGIFYPSTIGRDDSLTLWGNILDDKLQYRFMVGDGEDNRLKNPDDTWRFAGRLSYNFFDAETSWFNSENYLGKKKILALGIGADYQSDLFAGGTKDDYFAWTVDVHWDQPLENGDAAVFDASYINVSHSDNGVTWTTLSPGDDGHLFSAKAGYYFGRKLWLGNLQPFVQFQNIGSDESGEADTCIYGIGLNYFIKGPANKITLEATFIDQDKKVPPLVENHTMVTLQVAFGF